MKIPLLSVRVPLESRIYLKGSGGMHQENFQCRVPEPYKQYVGALFLGHNFDYHSPRDSMDGPDTAKIAF